MVLEDDLSVPNKLCLLDLNSVGLFILEMSVSFLVLFIWLTSSGNANDIKQKPNIVNII